MMQSAHPRWSRGSEWMHRTTGLRQSSGSPAGVGLARDAPARGAADACVSRGVVASPSTGVLAQLEALARAQAPGPIRAVRLRARRGFSRASADPGAARERAAAPGTGCPTPGPHAHAPARAARSAGRPDAASPARRPCARATTPAPDPPYPRRATCSRRSPARRAGRPRCDPRARRRLGVAVPAPPARPRRRRSDDPRRDGGGGYRHAASHDFLPAHSSEVFALPPL